MAVRHLKWYASWSLERGGRLVYPAGAGGVRGLLLVERTGWRITGVQVVGCHWLPGKLNAEEWCEVIIPSCPGIVKGFLEVIPRTFEDDDVDRSGV